MQIDPREKPPENLRAAFKAYQRTSRSQELDDELVVDFANGFFGNANEAFESIHWPCEPACSLEHETTNPVEDCSFLPRLTSVLAYRCKIIKGLTVIPALIPLTLQKDLLARLLHRDLVNAQHKTNVHFHHHVSYPSKNRSFFTCEPSDDSLLAPKDPQTHKTMSVGQFLKKKLRWFTLGGQYDWTEKAYPNEEPPAFPTDIANLLKSLFPETVPEAAIVNVYSPGDTLSLHRDVSEDSDKGLVSLSFGCDGLFMIGIDAPDDSQARYVVIRLRSGDAVYMQGASRFAWHGVPQIVANTCPQDLQSWPANSEEDASPNQQQPYQQWVGWMANKRINLNVRQMRR